MATPKRKSGFMAGLLEKNPDTLPFFSIHPKTLVGSILRGAFCVFILLVLLIQILGAKFNLLFIKYYDLYYLIYVVPVVIVIALALLALFKRMKTILGKILVPGLLGFLIISVIISLSSMFAMTAGYALSDKANLRIPDGPTLALMRACLEPEQVEVTVQNPDGTESTLLQYKARRDAYRYTAFPNDGVAGSVEGEILVSKASTYEVKLEWLDENNCRYYLASDSEGTGSGEIRISYEGESKEFTRSENAVYRSAEANAAGTHTVALYREDGFIDYNVDSVLQLTEESFTRIYTAYPVKLMLFIKTDTRVDGEIIVEPYGNLGDFIVDANEKDVYKIMPGENSVGATGSITVYAKEKAVNTEEVEAEPEAAAE